MEEQDGSVIGVLAAGRDGKVVFANGLGTDSRIRCLIGDEDWMAETRHRRMRTLILDRITYMLLLIAGQDCEFLLISRSPGEAVAEFVGTVDFAYDIVEYLISNPFDAMTVVNAQGKVVFISPVHERFFGLGHGGANGRPVRDVIENTGLARVAATGRAEIGEIQKMRNMERIVSRVPIRRGGTMLGAVGRIMFKGPEQLEELTRRISRLESEVEFYRREASALRGQSYGLDALIGNSTAMQRLRAEIVKIAPLELPVHIHGESGTGKELVAQSIHRLSARRDNALVMVNAAALPPTLVEAELFGYEAGSFTGADRKGRKGKFEQADGGTIFLDEIGDTSRDIQVKLLRVLQDRHIERVGGSSAREVDFRLVTATNQDLRGMMAENQFRLDLYYRIAAITIEVPPLRERMEDLPLLVAHFVDDFSARHGCRPPVVTDEAMTFLFRQLWPGNVRQLRHEIERAVVFAEDGRIGLNTMQDQVQFRRDPAVVPPVLPRLPFASLPPRGGNGSKSMRNARGELEIRLVRDTMERLRGNKKRVAEELGISRSYLYKLLGSSGVE